MITVTRIDKATGAVTRVAIPEGKDLVMIMQTVMKRLGLDAPKDDPIHDAIMALRKDGRGIDGLCVDCTPDGCRFPRCWVDSATGKLAASPKAVGELLAQSVSPEDRRPMVPIQEKVDLFAASQKAVGVRQTSRDAYHRAKFSGKLTAQQQRIVDWMRPRVGGATRQEIAQGTGITINATCGRVNELLDPEIGALRETGKRRCRITGETANALEIAK